MRYKWRPLQRANMLGAEPTVAIKIGMEQWDCSEEEARARLAKYEAEMNVEYWVNDIYQVAKSYHAEGVVQLNIRRRDGGPILRDWRHFQQIKNELVGEECEGIEIYPAESRKVDTSNKFHIWCITDPTYRFPFGFETRDIQEQEVKAPAGVRQRGV